MPLRGAAQCRRAVSRHVAASGSHLSMWITDEILVDAIARFQRSSLSSHRRLSSYPGPLESRRRLGKRHMTAALPTTHHELPTWRFDVAAALINWQWEAPTTAKDRQHKQPAWSVAASWDRLIKWLESKETGEPFIPPPRAISAVRPTHELRRRVQALSNPDAADRAEALGPYLHWMSSAVRSGDLTANEMMDMLYPFDEATLSQMSNRGRVRRFCETIGAAFVNDINALDTGNASESVETVWLKLLEGLTTLPDKTPSDTHYTGKPYWAFWFLMARIPYGPLQKVPPDKVCRMTQALVQYQDREYDSGDRRAWLGRAIDFGRALDRLSPVQWKAVCSQMEAAMQTGSVVPNAWLAIAACSTRHASREDSEAFIVEPHLEPQTKGNALQKIPHRGRLPLIVQRLNSLGCLDFGVYPQTLQNSEIRTRQLWGAGCILLMKTVSESAMDVSQQDALLRQLLFSPLANIPFRAIKGLILSKDGRSINLQLIHAAARSCNDHRLALLLQHWAFHISPRVLSGVSHRAVADKQGSHSKKDVSFHWTIWASYAERIIKDSQLPVHGIWPLLRRGGFLREATESETDETRKENKLQLVEDIARWHLESPSPTRRQLLRGIDNCIAHIRRLRSDHKSLSPELLATVSEVVAADLREGHRGRTERLRWLIGLAEQTHGREGAERVAERLDEWRDWNFEMGGRAR